MLYKGMDGTIMLMQHLLPKYPVFDTARNRPPDPVHIYAEVSSRTGQQSFLPSTGLNISRSAEVPRMSMALYKQQQR